MNPKVDLYLQDGCGRCEFYATPKCKVNNWREELEALRALVLSSGLTEELKWSVPCYTHKGKNVLIVSAFKENCTLSFFKGALLKDPDGLLEKPGENSQASRFLRFRSLQEILDREAVIRSTIKEAIALEEAGKKIVFKKEPEPLPEEFRLRLEEDPALRKAFQGLTPGRQRAYILHFSQAKQAQTRVARIEKSIPKILEGVGLYDDYKC
ncbi:MAG: YdeI/OmpD-associated family protein [Bacteroidales bacterium]